MSRVKLTESYIKSIPLPKAHHELHWDTEVKGLTVRITRNGSRYFVFCYTFDGQNRRYSLGPWSPPVGNKLGAPASRELAGTLTWARLEVQRLRGELAQGIDPTQRKKEARQARAAAKQEAAHEITVATLAERYLKEWAKPNKRSWREDERRLNAYIIPAWGARKAKDIRRADVSALVSPVATGDNPHIAEAGARLALVNKMFSFAIDQGIIEAHPSLRMKAPGGKPKPRTRALTTPAELRALWEATDAAHTLPADALPSERLRDTRLTQTEADALRLALLTGARASEVAELPWNELDLDAGTWLLPAARSKNKRANLLPLLPETVAMLRRRQESTQSEYVFPGPKRAHMTANNLSKPLRRLCTAFARDGIAPFTPHDLRRTVETGMAAAKVPKEYRDRVLNHVDASVGGMHYNMYDYMDEKREALEKWWRRLDRMITGNESNVVPLRRVSQ